MGTPTTLRRSEASNTAISKVMLPGFELSFGQVVVVDSVAAVPLPLTLLSMFLTQFDVCEIVLC